MCLSALRYVRRGALGLGLAAARGVGPCTWTIDVDACDASSADPSPHPGTRQRTHGKERQQTRQDSVRTQERRDDIFHTALCIHDMSMWHRLWLSSRKQFPFQRVAPSTIVPKAPAPIRASDTQKF